MLDSIEEIDVVCFSDICWDYLWQRHQNILTRFPHSWKILFIEPTSIPILLKNPGRIFLRREKNITIASLPSLPLVDRILGLVQINDYLVRLWLYILFKILDINDPILIYYEPRYSSLIGKLSEILVVYECVDDRLAFTGVPQMVERYIDNLIEKSDIIFTTSANLYDDIAKKRSIGVYLVGNGADVSFFKLSMSDICVPSDLNYIKEPIVGYIGAIDNWMDFDLIEVLAESRPNISLVFIGPINKNAESSVNKLKKFDNIFFIGKREYKVLPNYLKAFSICIIPFKINRLTISVNPVKLYEYMASGKNVVSTDLPEVRKYESPIYIGRGTHDFIKKIDLALSNEPDIESLLCLANQQSWDKKADEMIKLISERLSYLN